MPYRTVEVNFDCCMRMCLYNDDGECNADENEDELRESSSCMHYASVFDEKNHDKIFQNIPSLINYIEHSAGEYPFVAIDENSTRLVFKEMGCPNKSGAHEHACFFQMTKESENELDFRPGVDGGIVFTSKAQLSLEF